MTARVESRRSLAFAGLLGLYAAAVALAPNSTTRLLAAAPLLLAPLAWGLITRPLAWVAWFVGSALLLPPLPFALGNSGPHPALFFAAAGVGIGLLRLDEWRLPGERLSEAMLLFLAALALSLPFALLTAGFETGAGSIARVAMYGISNYLFFYLVHGPGCELRIDGARAVGLLFCAAAAAGVFACADFYYQFPAPSGYGPQFVYLDGGVFRRAQGLFYEASTLGNFCVFFLVMIVAMFLRPRRERFLPAWALGLGGSVLMLALILSYSRASIVNLVVAAAVLAWLNRDHFSVRKAVLAVVLCTAGGAALAWAFLPGFAELFWMRLSGSAQYFFSETEGVLSGRLANWRVLSGFIGAHPWYVLLGIGYKTLPYSDFIGRATIGDNMYLTLLVETGLVGLGAMLFLLWQILRASLRAARSLKPRAAFLGAWSFSFWVGQLFQMFSGDLLTYWRVMPVYFFVLALAVRETDA